MALDVLQWTKESREDVNFLLEGKLLFTPSIEVNWKKVWTVKMSPVTALLVTLGHHTVDPPAMPPQSSANSGAASALTPPLQFPVETGVREAALLLIREKNKKYYLIRVRSYNYWGPCRGIFAERGSSGTSESTLNFFISN